MPILLDVKFPTGTPTPRVMTPVVAICHEPATSKEPFNTKIGIIKFCVGLNREAKAVPAVKGAALEKAVVKAGIFIKTIFPILSI